MLRRVNPGRLRRELKDAYTGYRQGNVPLERLREIEDRAILKVLDMQTQVGLDVVSDGEYRRGGWASDFQDAVAGYVPGSPLVVMSCRPLRMWLRAATSPG